MIEICPAGPPKLISPSFNQNQKACSKLTGAGRSGDSDIEGLQQLKSTGHYSRTTWQLRDTERKITIPTQPLPHLS
jgi:hypothetical protein